MHDRREWIPGYKVVRYGGSFFLSEGSTGYVSYKPGKVSTRNDGCGPLAVFANRTYAKTFLDGSDGGAIRIMACAYLYSKNQTGLWYRAFGTDIPDTMDVRELPPGTRLADAVYILEVDDFGDIGD